MTFQAQSLCLQMTDTGFHELVFSAPGPINKLDRETLLALHLAITQLERTTDLAGLLIRSNKSDFILGADITEFLSMFSWPEAALAAWLADINALFCRLEALPCPTICLLQGQVLGGGCELALCADFRIATPDTQIGLPETRLGIMPGWGGSVRLPRLIGRDPALEWIVSGLPHPATEALHCGAVDTLVEPGQLQAIGEQMLRSARAGQLDWQARRSRKRSPLRLAESESTLSIETAQAQLSSEIASHYPAPLRALTSLTHSDQLDFDVALRIEREHFISLAKTPQATALIGNFLHERDIKHQAKAMAAPAIVRQMAIIGAGIMGSGIARQSARQHIQVHLQDLHAETLQASLTDTARWLSREVDQQRTSSLTLAQTLSCLHSQLNYGGFEQVDLALETVTEQVELKRAVLLKIEQALSPHAMLASNTSTIPIGLLASGLQRPEQFCGLHFFNPVHKMSLVEVIRGPETADATLSRACQYALTLGKIPVLVGDGPGFFVNRVLFAYFAAFRLLLADGIDPYRIDRVMEQFGWPMGPAWLLDVVGLDTAHQAAGIMAQSFPNRMAIAGPDPIEQLFQSGHYGQKNGRGFYLYRPDAHGTIQKRPDSNWSLHWPHHTDGVLPDVDIEARLLLPLLFETLLCLQEGIIASPAAADLALRHGLNFPAFRGGPFRFMEQTGLKHLVHQADRLAALGPLYRVPNELRYRAAKKQHFY